MNPTRFDRFSRLLATRRTRRQSIATGGLGIAAMSLLATARAQDATPVATPAATPSAPHPSADSAGTHPEFLFVQPFDGGTWAPKAGEEGTYTLTLTGAAAQTTYFSDRPERIVGLSPTQAFLDGLGFTPENPPNAALVAQTEAGETEILVIELLNPVYDAEAGMLTYDARVLADYGERGLAHLAQQQTDYEFPDAFGEGSLFIDDCSSWAFTCVDQNGRFGTSSGGNFNACYSSAVNACVTCDHVQDALNWAQTLCHQYQSTVCGDPNAPYDRRTNPNRPCTIQWG